MFKAGLGAVLGGAVLIRPLALLFVPSFCAGIAVLAFWP